jgi:hypothetical protein
MSCFLLRACSLVLHPFLGGRKGGTYVGKGVVSSDELEESEEISRISGLEDMIVLIVCFWKQLGLFDDELGKD